MVPRNHLAAPFFSASFASYTVAVGPRTSPGYLRLGDVSRDLVAIGGLAARNGGCPLIGSRATVQETCRYRCKGTL